MPITFDDLLARARALTGTGRRAILGIAGGPGAGKTTLAEALVRDFADPDGVVAHRAATVRSRRR
ncbi:hypothetical protein SFUMM280S_06165 [Streptomyces fumanus]